MEMLLYEAQVEKWCVFEVTVMGHRAGNPFVDYTITGTFTCKNETIIADGFYDGDGVYKVRCMPSFVGNYTFELKGSFSEDTYTGKFNVEEASCNNHGPVGVSGTFHFAYGDGKPYYSFGTTCYVWTHQPEALQLQTLETLKNSGFNKIRFCIFPKHYVYNFNEPITYPFEGTPMDSSVLTKENFNQYNGNAPGNDWDFQRFNPEHFRLIERRILDLIALGIEADLIVMHPYDRWGFSEMRSEADDRYWRYVIARFASFRNV